MSAQTADAARLTHGDEFIQRIINGGGRIECEYGLGRIIPAQTTPPLPNTFLITSAPPLGDIDGRIPNYRISLGVELRFIVPIANFPLRLIFAYNPNAQTSPPPATLLAPEKRFAFRIGFGRTL